MWKKIFEIGYDLLIKDKAQIYVCKDIETFFRKERKFILYTYRMNLYSPTFRYYLNSLFKDDKKKIWWFFNKIWNARKNYKREYIDMDKWISGIIMLLSRKNKLWIHFL